MSAARTISLIHCESGGHRELLDQVAVEEPLEIRLDGHPVAVVMRTPGHDVELVTGFLLTEGIIASVADLRKTESRPEENRVLAFLNDGVTVDPRRLTRHLFASSSCGLCGKATLEAILTDFPPLSAAAEIADAVLLAAPLALRAAQSAFDSTGGLHAAGIFDETGRLLVLREDIGRHNATDKAIGHSRLHQVDLSRTFLLVSGRVSFEIMQKALAARIPLVAGISAPSSLAIDFAKASGQHLVGFLRPPTFNRYA